MYDFDTSLALDYRAPRAMNIYTSFIFFDDLIIVLWG